MFSAILYTAQIMNEVSAPKSYILNINQVTERELDEAGEKAVNLGQLARLGAPITPGFIITSKTFDDYLFANDLISQIGEVNRQVTHAVISTKVAENRIGKLIMASQMPNLTYEMLNRAYNLLTNGNKTTLLISTSSVNPELKESVIQNPMGELLAEDFETFIEMIKLSWTQLFSSDALKFRIENKYRGILTQALVVSKYLQPEVSGEIYTLSIENADPTITEIRAVYGHNHKEVEKTFSDRYLFDKSTEEIIEKYKNEQEWMLIAKNSRFEKQKIAKSRKETPKLTEIQILKLAKTTTKLKEYFKNELKISWQFHGGKFSFTEMSRLTERDIISARELLTKKPENSKEKHNLHDGFRLKPLNELTAVAIGNGNKKGISYGRVRIVKNKKDLENAQGVDILVCPKIFRGLDLSQVRYRGLVIESSMKYDESELPAVSSVDDATNLLLENEIVTIDTNTGKIYLGAGYQSVNTTKDQPEVKEIETASRNLNNLHLSMHSPVTHGIFKKTTSNEEVDTNKSWLPNTMAQTYAKEVVSEIPRNTNSIDEEWYLKKPEFRDEDIKEGKTSCGYWQIFNIHDPVVLQDTDGIYVKLSEILGSLDLDKYELGRNSPLKTKFLNFISEYLSVFEEFDQIMLLLDINKSAKTTIAEEGILDLQLEIVKHLKNKGGVKNISIILPDVRTEKDLITMKKSVTSIGLRRSATFNVYVEIASPLAAISLRKMVEDGLDGMIIDLDKLLYSLYEEDKSRLTHEVSEFLAEVMTKVSKSSAKLLLAANKVVLNDDELRQFVESGLLNFVFPDRKIIELSGMISNMEIKNLKRNKRGRKPKEINYK